MDINSEVLHDKLNYYIFAGLEGSSPILLDVKCTSQENIPQPVSLIILFTDLNRTPILDIQLAAAKCHLGGEPVPDK